MIARSVRVLLPLISFACISCAGNNEKAGEILTPPLQFNLQVTRTQMSDGRPPNGDLTSYSTERIAKIWVFGPSLVATTIQVDFVGESGDRYRELGLFIPRDSQLVEGAVFVDGAEPFAQLAASVREHPRSDDEFNTSIRTWIADQTRLEVVSRNDRVVRMRLTARLSGTGGGGTIPQESADGFLHLEGEIAIDFANQEKIDLLGD